MAKIILIQALPAPRLDSRENLTRALTLLQGCQEQEADLICFPEYFPFWGEEELAAAAARLQVHIIAGLVEEADGRRYNTATLFDRRGRLLGRQRKHNLGNLERRGFGVVPGSGWQVWDTDFGRLGAPGVHRFLGPARGGPAPGGCRGGSHRQSRHFPHSPGPLADRGPDPGLRLLPAGGRGEYRGGGGGDCRTPLPASGRAFLCHPTSGPRG